MTTMEEIFGGLQRKRLPGMHMITALDGGVSLREALAAAFFMILHDKYPHTCLIKQAETKVQAATVQAARGSRSLDGMFMAGIFGQMASAGLAEEEWSYLPDEEVFSLYLIADIAIEQTQRWICQGVEIPKEIALGPLVVRPEWALADQATHDRQPWVQKACKLVARLSVELAESSA